MDVLALCGLQDRACSLFHDAESILYWVSAFAASACSGRHARLITCLMNEREPAPPLSRKQRKKLEARQRAEVTARSETILQSRLVRFGKRLLDLAVLVIGVVGAIAGLWSFFPAFSVSSNPPLNPFDALTSPFVIRYESPIPVSDVDPTCTAMNLLDAHHNEIGPFSVTAPALRVPEMWQGDTVTVPCAARYPFNTPPIIYGDITILVKFKPFLVPRFLHLHSWTHGFRFITVRYSNGTFGWVPEPGNYHPERWPPSPATLHNN